MRKPVMIRLSDEEREGLERHRRAMGERSFAGVVRSWIGREPQKATPEPDWLGGDIAKFIRDSGT